MRERPPVIRYRYSVTDVQRKEKTNIETVHEGIVFWILEYFTFKILR